MLHGNAFEFNLPSLVQEFYDGFNENNIDRNNGITEVKWRGELKIVHLQTILELTVIPLGESRIQNPKNLGDYIHLMGDHCKSTQGGGISVKTVYRTVYALCRWLHQNVLGISHVSLFYNQALHIVYILMTKERQFCMCRTLLDTRRKMFPPLPTLVTQICKE